MAGTTEYKNKWLSEHADRINLAVSKGKKAIIQKAAKNNGESLNGYINRLIDEDLEAHPVD